MNEPWAIYIPVFILVAVAAQQLQLGLRGLTRSRRERSRRFASLDRLAPLEDGDTLRRRSSRFGGSIFASRISRLIVQSGSSLSVPTLGLIGLALTLLFWLFLPAPANVLLRFALAAIGSVILLGLWLRIKRARRMARFGEQLPEVIDVIVRSLKAGHPLAVSLNLVARETPEPAGTEFGLVVDEVSYGRSLSEALENLYYRVGYPELRFFVASTAIAHQTGGNLGEILARLSRMLRERFRLARRVRALSAEGRFSGYALSILPIALFGLINLVSASYYAEFWTTPAAAPVVEISIGLLMIGNFVIYRLVNFKV